MKIGTRSLPRSLSASHALRRIGYASILASVVACAGHDPSAQLDAADIEAARSSRISVLKDAIARDHETLQALVTRPRGETESPLHDDPTLQAIARRLSDQERELEQLVAAEAKANAPSTLR